MVVSQTGMTEQAMYGMSPGRKSQAPSNGQKWVTAYWNKYCY